MKQELARSRGPVAISQGAFRAWLSSDSEWAFVARFSVVGVAALAASSLLAALRLPGALDFAAPAAAALIVGLTYLRRPAEALLAFAVIAAFHYTVAYYATPLFRQFDEFAVAIFAILAFARAASSWRAWWWWPREAAVAVVFGSALLSSLLAGVPPLIWLPALALAVKPFAFVYAVMWTPIKLVEVRAAMRVMIIVGLAVLALGIFELLNPALFEAIFRLPAFQPRGGIPVVKSVFVHPALFGFFTAFIALFSFAAYTVTRRMSWLALAFAFTLGPILSARRRAILALVAGLAAALADTLRRRPSPIAALRLWAPPVAGMMVLVIVFMPLLSNLYSLAVDAYVPSVITTPSGTTPQVPIEVDDENLQPRVALYVAAARIAADHAPFGVGLGRYASWISRTEYSPVYEQYGLSTIPGLRPSNPTYLTDTFWPQIVGEFGLIGFLGYVGFLASIGILLWREAARRSDEVVARVLRMGAGMVFAQAIVESLANAMFHSPPRVFLVYLVVGVVLSFAWRLRASSDPEQTDPEQLQPAQTGQ